jgi:hypothetical protein
MSIIVIQCAARKRGKPFTHNGSPDGTPISFVANPAHCAEPGFPCVTPDDIIPATNISWRQRLIDYNNAGSNPLGLSEAVDLYDHPIYDELAQHFGRKNVYILSAGWGLVRGDYLLPDYNITFSSAQNVPKCSKRKRNQEFRDFNHLAHRHFKKNDSIYFFGGRDYLEMFYRCAENINPMRKVVYYISNRLDQEENRRPGYEYIRYPNPTNRRTNWHYSCAEDFLEGRIPR